MNTYSTVDRESFQKLLANAFAVQQSQMDRQSLSAIVEVERSITRGEVELDGAMHLIADHARNVANATGVAIGLLRGDQLVYRAGSGSAAAYIGKCVLATLTISADTKASGELLRVENTQTDPRIEAGVCRQFGAKSLLILLIYHDRAVAGLLQVLFSEPHVFQDREVRTYRLMAGLIGEAMSHAAQLERGENPAAELPTNPRAIEQITPEMEKFLNDGGPMPGPANKPAILQPCGAAMAVTGELPVLRQPAEPATMIMRVPWHKRRRNVALAAVAAVLVIACWIAYSDRRPNSALGPSALQRSIAIGQQAPSLPAKAVPAKGTSKLQTTPVPVEQARSARTTRQRMRVRQSGSRQGHRDPRRTSRHRERQGTSRIPGKVSGGRPGCGESDCRDSRGRRKRSKGHELLNSDLDEGIEKNLDAALIQNKLHKSVKYEVKSGVVTLTGEVNSQDKRDRVEKVAAGVPNVKQVVNDLQVKNQKASSSQ